MLEILSYRITFDLTWNHLKVNATEISNYVKEKISNVEKISCEISLDLSNILKNFNKESLPCKAG